MVVNTISKNSTTFVNFVIVYSYNTIDRRLYEMNKDNTIGAKIQSYRKLQNMTQDELSKRSGIYLSTIKKYESGERNPKPDQLQKISEALGVSITVFLDFEINTVSDVISLIIKLDEQASLKITADKDERGLIIPSTIRLSFDDPQINDAICSYLECKDQVHLASNNSSDPTMTEISIQATDETKNRLLLYNTLIKKSVH